MFRPNRAIAMAGGLVCLLGLGFYESTRAQQATVISVDQPTVLFSNVAAGGTSTQTININSSVSTTVLVDTSNAPSWLKVSPTTPLNVASGTPTPLTINVNTAGPPVLTPGTYQGAIKLSPQSGQGSATTVIVTLQV